MYHITQRCHDRNFLLKFAQDRNAYRRWLREGLALKSVSLLNYCITSNHVHLLVRGQNEEEIGAFMQYVAGGSAQAYHLWKKVASAGQT